MRKTVLVLVQAYQKFFSPDTGFIGKVIFPNGACIYQPTCSQYTLNAVRQYGIITGFLLGIKRIWRCRPGKQGGFDPVP